MPDRPRHVRMCTKCGFRTNRRPEDEEDCPNDGTLLVIDPEAPRPRAIVS